LCSPKPPLGLRLVYSAQRDDLVPARQPGNELDALARERKPLGEETQNGFIRLAVLGYRGDAHFPTVAVTADDGVRSGARRDANT
jgi:hypothetical protein